MKASRRLAIATAKSEETDEEDDEKSSLDIKGVIPAQEDTSSIVFDEHLSHPTLIKMEKLDEIDEVNGDHMDGVCEPSTSKQIFKNELIDPPTQTTPDYSNIKLESWASQLTSAIQTIESHQQDEIGVSSTHSQLPSSSSTYDPSSSSSSHPQHQNNHHQHHHHQQQLQQSHHHHDHHYQSSPTTSSNRQQQAVGGHHPVANCTATTEAEIIWKSFSNHSSVSNQHHYETVVDLNQAGPSSRGLEYTPRHSNSFFVGSYETDYNMFTTTNQDTAVTVIGGGDSGTASSSAGIGNSSSGTMTSGATVGAKNSRFLEFIEDGQTATWRHPFSPQYVNFDGDRNSSYMDLDACKATTSSISQVAGVYNRAASASTESLNIRTDEKMPAKGEISEQESNGEVEISWNHHQVIIILLNFCFMIFILLLLNSDFYFLPDLSVIVLVPSGFVAETWKHPTRFNRDEGGGLETVDRQSNDLLRTKHTEIVSFFRLLYQFLSLEI